MVFCEHCNAASAPTGESSRTYVTRGENITYTCRVQYNSSAVLKMAWSTSPGEPVAPPGGRVSTDDSHDSLIQLESKLTIAVPMDAVVVPTYVCSVVSAASSSSQQVANRELYTWNSTAIVVSCECLIITLFKQKRTVIYHFLLHYCSFL